MWIDAQRLDFEWVQLPLPARICEVQIECSSSIHTVGLIETDDQSVALLGHLDGRYHYVRHIDGDKGVRLRPRSRMNSLVKDQRRRDKFLCDAHHSRVRPESGVGHKNHAEGLQTLILPLIVDIDRKRVEHRNSTRSS